MPRSQLIGARAHKTECITFKSVCSGARMQCTMGKRADAVDTGRLSERGNDKIGEIDKNQGLFHFPLSSGLQCL